LEEAPIEELYCLSRDAVEPLEFVEECPLRFCQYPLLRVAVVPYKAFREDPYVFLRTIAHRNLITWSHYVTRDGDENEARNEVRRALGPRPFFSTSVKYFLDPKSRSFVRTLLIFKREILAGLGELISHDVAHEMRTVALGIIPADAEWAYLRNALSEKGL
jgi:hypothetical protein